MKQTWTTRLAAATGALGIGAATLLGLGGLGDVAGATATADPAQPTPPPAVVEKTDAHEHAVADVHWFLGTIEANEQHLGLAWFALLVFEPEDEAAGDPFVGVLTVYDDEIDDLAPLCTGVLFEDDFGSIQLLGETPAGEASICGMEQLVNGAFVYQSLDESGWVLAFPHPLD